MMKTALELFGFFALVGEYLTIYTMVACITYGEAFPAWFPAALYLMVFAMLSGVAVGVMAIVRWVRRKTRRDCLGTIKFDMNGRMYYEK